MDEKWEVEPQSDLAELLDRVSHGETVELTRDGKTVARIVPAETQKMDPPTWAELTELRKGVTLPDGVTIKDLITEGRRM